MPDGPVIHSEFDLDGFLPLWGVVVVGVALLVVSWWMARHDARFTERRGWGRALLILRTVAILVLLWMLAGPTWVSTLRSFHKKTVAILVDQSASMGLVDGVDGSGNVTRWAAARSTDSEYRPLRDLDEGAAILEAAREQLDRFGRIPDTQPDTAAARDLLNRAVSGLDSGLNRVRQGAGGLGGESVEIQRTLLEAIQTTGADLVERARRKGADFNRGKSLAGLERAQWLPDTLSAAGEMARRVEGLADELARRTEHAIAIHPPDGMERETTLSRLDKVDALLGAAEHGWLKDLRGKVVVQAYGFGDKVVPLGTGPWSSPPPGTPPARPPLAASTRLGSALQQVAVGASSRPVDAAILLTDGGQNAGRDPRKLAASLSATTLHIVPTGNTTMQRDVILHHTHAPKAVIQNDQVVVDSIITAYDCDREDLQVELLDNTNVVDRKTLTVAGTTFDGRVQLRWKAAELGKHTLDLRVLPVGKERSEDNNAARADVHVLEDNIRIFIADNFPRWETRYLLNLFKRDERVSFDQLLIEPRRVSTAKVRRGLPRTAEEWSRYRVVILGDLPPSEFPVESQKSLVEYVTRGGGNVILVAGRDAMPAEFVDQPLGTLLPVEPGRRDLPPDLPFYLHLTDEGSLSLATQIGDNPGDSERIWLETSTRMPVYDLSDYSRAKLTAHSLLWASSSRTSFNPAQNTTRSFLAWQYVGAGRVVYLAAPVTYQLRYRKGDTFHHRFWGQLIRWAIARDLAEGSRTVRLSTDKSRYEQGESTEVSVHLSRLDGSPVSGGGPLQIAAIQDGRRIQEFGIREDSSRPGAYHGVLEQLPVGPVRIQVTGDPVKALLADEDYRRPVETTVTIDPSDSLELRHPLCNLALLRELADAGGGILVPPTGLGAALQQMNLEPEVLEHVTRLPLWNRWDLFWIFIICLSLEWACRKYLGLS